MTISERVPLVVTGSPAERGRAIAASAVGLREGVVERVRSAPDLSADEAAWVDQLWQAQQTHLPEMCELISGLAEGFGLGARDLFTRHVGYALEDRRNRPAPDPDGCSAFAIRTGDGVLVAKNRDNPPSFKPLQTLIRQRDPAWNGREVLSISTFGSSPTASSGINSDGLCMADTSVRTSDLGVGVLRYYLMDAILYRCRDVPEAIAFVTGLPHLGGGNLVLGDAAGRMATIEISHSRVVVEEDEGRGWVARTNHFLDPALAAHLMTPPGSEARRNSESRLAYLHHRLSPGVAGWTFEDCASTLASHGSSDYEALCRHDETVLTLSGTVFDARARTLTQSRDTPCLNDWYRSGFEAIDAAPRTMAEA